MVDLSILSSSTQAIDPAEFPAISSLTASPSDSGCERATIMADCTRQDVVAWTPELWWLLNWWISLFPPPQQTPESIDDGTPGIYTVEQMPTEQQPASHERINPGPSLSEIEESQPEHSEPPEARETTLRVINLGNGMIDLFA